MTRLIDADELLKALNEKGVEYRADINAEIMNAPTIDAEPVRHGKWKVERSHDGYATGIMECSNCGWLFSYVPALEEEWNCCPHCGAIMDKEAEDD